ncbi:hypothetical protein EYF80_024432 [Liparis tanakae]|uniref:Uncharacterized protein n=1 Tax=Liparis tanakae TaxID=230148 RepID=A0A4Z2HHE3_9TELE|nr:hypothetical protein EYF80_024432 [Liparis tanakae]
MESRGVKDQEAERGAVFVDGVARYESTEDCHRTWGCRSAEIFDGPVVTGIDRVGPQPFALISNFINVKPAEVK